MQKRPPLFMLLFFSLFGFIGITVLVSVWTASGFGAPPTFFKIFASFIAIGFILMGFGVPLSALKARSSFPAPGMGSNSVGSPAPSKTASSYDCPNCGANAGDADVSPSGDLRCRFCNEWWNIHRR